jgi:predicted ester cyclase
VIYDPNKEDSSEDKLNRFKGLHVKRHSFQKKWEFIDTIKNLHSAFPDLHYEEQEIISQDDRVVFIGIVTGTHKGSFFFIPPTGNKISYEAVHIHKIGKDGKIIEHRAIRDDLKFMWQLGLVIAASPEYEKFFKAWKEID